MKIKGREMIGVEEKIHAVKLRGDLELDLKLSDTLRVQEKLCTVA